MNKNFLTALLLATASGVSAQTDVSWQVLSHQTDTNGKPTYTQRFIVSGDMTDLARLCFDQFDRPMTPTDPSDTVARIIPGYYYIASPRFSSGGSPVVIDIVTEGTCPQYSYGADGVHGVDHNGKPFNVNFTRLSGTSDPLQWSLPGKDGMPYGDKFYDINEAIASSVPVSPYDVVPSFKKVTAGSGVYKGSDITGKKIVKADNPEFYRINITPQGISIEGASQQALAMAQRVVTRLLNDNPDGLPVATIEDFPDFGYRGMMIDVARNFQTLDQMKKFVDVMADYRMNRLQFHFIDDEAWRLEIPGLPELTEYGSRRGYTIDEDDFLAQIYAGNGDPASDTNHGMYTRQEFIDFLKYCQDKGITVIPEIETPGHARAAVKAMEARYRKTGDATYRLREDGDTSVYRSAQDFGDNVMNPALPGPYKFMDKVLDEVIAMYREAGVPLETIHIGGDEVPHGAWSGSPSAQKFMKEHGMTEESQLHAHWVKEMAKAISKRGLNLAGWQEIGLGHSDEYSAELTPNVGFINLWISKPGRDGIRPGTKALEAGYPVLISAVDNFYLDLAYSHHPDERGLIWGGVIDEFKSLDGYPFQIAPAGADAKGKIVGVQGQMWAETMRSPQWMESYLFPRLLGVAERAWNADSTYNHQQFNSVIEQRELPWLEGKNVNYHLRQPGIKMIDGKIRMNSPYAKAVIRYTLDGAEPTADSPVYTSPITPGNASQVRARLFYNGKESVASILNLKK